MPFVFSDRESAHNRSLEDPAWGFCVSFCCKEAVYKALGSPYNFPDCELCATPLARTGEAVLADHLRREEGIGAVLVEILDMEDVVVVAYVCEGGPVRRDRP